MSAATDVRSDDGGHYITSGWAVLGMGVVAIGFATYASFAGRTFFITPPAAALIGLADLVLGAMMLRMGHRLGGTP